MLLLLVQRKKFIARIFLCIFYVHTVLGSYASSGVEKSGLKGVPYPQGWNNGSLKISNGTHDINLRTGEARRKGKSYAAAGNKETDADKTWESSGPTQPEMKSFQSVNANNMVDLFTGDFSYNIPLLDVGGYPVNLHYSSGITMDEEASWVGLGWNINPGTITRNLRGMPDDFDGTDSLQRTQHIKENKTVGVSLQGSLEIFGDPGRIPRADLSATLGIFKNTYNGYGIETGVGIGGTGKTAFGSLTGNLSISNNSQTGLTVSPSLSARIGKSDGENNMRSSLGISSGYYSRGGISSLQLYGGIQSDAIEYQKTNQYIGANNSFPLANISFAVPAYTPTITMPVSNSSFSFTGKIGGELSGVDASAAFTGYVNKSEILDIDTTKKIPAIGYLYSTLGNDKENILLDFNREKEMEFNYKTTPNIALPQYTYDAFSIAGEGTGGSFRAYRGDVGYVFDHSIVTKSNTKNGSIDVGCCGITHVGLEVTKVTTANENHRWNQSNLIEKNLKFQTADSTYEPVYFRNPGEKSINSKAYYQSIGDDTLIRIKLNGSKDAVSAASTFIKYANGQKAGEIQAGQVIKKGERDKRTQMISYLTATDASSFGLDKSIVSYPENSIPVGACIDAVQLISRVDGLVHKPNHISEVTVLNSDGRRYVYGIPVYNVSQEDVTFAVDKNSNSQANIDSGLVNYQPYVDNTTKNSNGKDGYFSKDSMPAYSHSFLLTGILSPDYIDITGNGISEDDPGDAVKFNYTQVYGAANGYYPWRTPLSQNKANYNEGFKTYNRDDKGTYLYGQKELWYLNSIESKTMIAVFTVANDRKDGYSAIDENGGVNPAKVTRRLDKIDLYAKADLIRNGVTGARPIKTVHFAYSYDLCKGIMGMGKTGKLTLDSVWFTYNNNNKGKLNPYVFNYHPDANSSPLSAYNPSYNSKYYDRWGTYKDPISNPGKLSNTEYPYTAQDSTLAAQYASAWHLTDIQLPSGGRMQVTYEADDYEYVQNQRATRMFTIAGIGNSSQSSSRGNTLYNTGVKSRDDYYTIFVNSDDVLTSKADILNKYLGIDSVLYFKLAVQMPADTWGSGYELVPGYATVADYGLSKGNNKQFWITLAPVEGRSPLSRSALQFFRLNLPSKAYPESEKGDNIDLGDAIKMLVSGFREIKNSIDGFDNVAKGNNLCSTIDTTKSFIRLSCPNFKKYGGGVRVKRIQIADNWKQMAGQNESVYGQEYNYTTSEDVNGQPVIISSGVASYEPVIGGEENPWHRPVSYIEKLAPLAPANFLFSEEPIGESYFPSPMVGYRKVRVRTINAHALSANGWEETEFYTTKDFPTLVEHTLLEDGDSKRKYETSSSILRLNHKNHVTLSQGFRIELNDMNGKTKAQSTYAETDSLHPIRYTLNFYKVDNNTAYQKHLNNQVWVVDSANGHIDTAGQMGKDIEVMADLREQHSKATTKGFSPNVDVIPFFGFPVPIPSAYNFPQSEDVRFRSAAVVKIVQRYGILDSVVAMDKGSVVSTKNLVYDAETGNVLLARTNNEFNDPVYNFNYPAYWAYSGMGLAYKNLNAVFNDNNGMQLINGKLYKAGDTTVFPEHFFESGDEVYISNANVASMGSNCRYLSNPGVFWTGKLWLIDAAKGSGNSKGLYLIDSLGRIPPNLLIKSMRIIRSGKRNMPDVSAGSVVMLGSPLQQVNGQYHIAIDSTTKVLNASVSTYKDLWQVENVLYQADSTYNLYKTNQTATVYNTSSPAVFRKFQFKHKRGFETAFDLDEGTVFPGYFVASSKQYHAYTKHSNVYQLKSAVQYDLSFLDPSTTIINSASLSLYANAPVNAWNGITSPNNVQKDFQAKTASDYQTGALNKNTNGSLLKPILAPWDATTSYDGLYTSPNGGISLGTAPDGSCTDMTNITGIKAAVQNMVRHPASNYGFSIELSSYTTGDESNSSERTMSFCGWPSYVAEVEAKRKSMVAQATAGCTSCSTGIQLNLNYSSSKDTTVKVCRQNIVDSATNPYRWGILGNWRMERAYTYYNSRQESDASVAATNTRTEGTLKNFVSFWTFNQNGILPNPDTTRWVWNSSLSKFNRKGAEIENYDPLNRHNSGLYGYNQTMPVAVAQNSRYRELLYDGFEDYGYKTTYCTTCAPQREFDFLAGNKGVDTTTAQSHTGLYSMRVKAGFDAKLVVPVVTRASDTIAASLLTYLDSSAVTTTTVVGSGTGLRGDYYTSYFNQDIGTCALSLVPTTSRTDSTLNFDWTEPPAELAGCSDEYQVIWTGKVQAKYSGAYVFYFNGSGSVIVEVNNTTLFTSTDQSGSQSSNPIYLSAGTAYPIYIQYSKSSNDVNGKVQFGWSSYISGPQSYQAVIPKNFMYVPTGDTTGSVKTIVNYWCVSADTVKPVNVIRQPFSPLQGSQLSVSAWVRLDLSDCNSTPAPDSVMQVNFDVGGKTTSHWLKKTGLRIEGWQRYEDTVPVPPTASQMSIHAKAPSNYNIYVDDIRVQPFNSNSKSYIYNPFNLRLMADLDENNYATFYEYDDDGTLIRVKKETERGIMTIKETRSALYKDQ